MEPALVSAAVAAVVTLLIELIAKPSIDARKERILHRHRQSREVRRRLGQLAFAIGRYDA
jgi:hypothetical protein